jgi:carboxyl-terminal processing protease
MRGDQRFTSVHLMPHVTPLAASKPALIRLIMLLLISFSLVFVSCTGEAATTPTPTSLPTTVIETGLTASERLAILDAVWETINKKYYDPTFGGLDWHAVGDEYRQRLATVQDDKTFWLEVLNPMLFELGVSHLVALPPSLANELERMTFATGSLGMDVRLLDGMAVVTQVIEGSPAGEAGLQPGFVITSVDGRTLSDIAAESITSPPNNERHLLGIPLQSMRGLLYGETGTEIVIEYLDASDQPHRATLQFAARVGSACDQLDPAMPPACGEIEVRRLANNIGYIRFSGFLSSVMDGVLQAIDEMHDAPGLIIDLRGNPGGQYFVRVAIASQLVGTPELFIRYQYRDHLEEGYLDPVPNAYPGAVVILVDEFSASSSEEFSGSLQALGRATIVGSQTPGVCLVMNIETLPYGTILAYPIAQSQTSDGRVLEDNGVVPDIEVALDRQQLLQGRDAQLEAALNHLEQEAAVRIATP